MKNIFAPEFILLQLNDALFPIGSYTQSYGLETYVQQNRVTDKTSFKTYLQANLRYNLLYNDLLLVKLAYFAAKENDLDQLKYLDQLSSASKPAREIREASSKLASRLIKTMQSLNLTNVLPIYSVYVALVNNKELSGHYALCYGLLAAALELNYTATLHCYAYAQISAVVNNGVKLIPLSQTTGQQLLFELHAELSESLAQLENLTINNFGRACPAFELRAMQHEQLYSRLYMS